MNYLKKHKLFTICYTILVILSISLVIFTYHNHSFYKETIAKITSTQEEYISTDTITYGYHEDIYMQTIKAIGFEDKFIEQGSQEELYLQENITIQRIKKEIDILNKNRRNSW